MNNNTKKSSPFSKEQPLPSNVNNSNDQNVIINRSSNNASDTPSDYDHILSRSDEYTLEEIYT